LIQEPNIPHKSRRKRDWCQWGTGRGGDGGDGGQRSLNSILKGIGLVEHKEWA